MREKRKRRKEEKRERGEGEKREKERERVRERERAQEEVVIWKGSSEFHLKLIGNDRQKHRFTGVQTLINYFSAALSLSLPCVTKAMLQSTQRAKPSFTNSSAMLPAYVKQRHAYM